MEKIAYFLRNIKKIKTILTQSAKKNLPFGRFIFLYS